MKPIVGLSIVAILSAADGCHHHPDRMVPSRFRGHSEVQIQTKKANEVIKSIQDRISKVPTPAPQLTPARPVNL